jgi:hypothetical protein
MYNAMLIIHSVLRWIVLLLAIAAIGVSLRGWLGDRERGGLHRGLGGAFVGSVHLEVLLGLLLYFVYSPLTKAAFEDFGAAMKDAVLRFWAVEHLTLMVLAAVFATIGSVVAKRAEEDRVAHRRATIGFGLALLTILAGIPWPFREMGRPLFRIF